MLRFQETRQTEPGFRTHAGIRRSAAYPGDGNATLLALFFPGASRFMSLVAAYALTIVELKDRRRRRQQSNR